VNKRKITKVIIGVVVIAAATGYFLQQAIESSWVYYYSVDEFAETETYKILQSGDAKASKADFNRIIRVAGTVKENSIVRGAEQMQLDFELAGKKAVVPVRYYGTVPKNFTEGKEVVVQGRISDKGLFKADKILTRCESKYKVKS